MIKKINVLFERNPYKSTSLIYDISITRIEPEFERVDIIRWNSIRPFCHQMLLRQLLNQFPEQLYKFLVDYTNCCEFYSLFDELLEKGNYSPYYDRMIEYASSQGYNEIVVILIQHSNFNSNRFEL